MSTFHALSMKSIAGEPIDFSDYQGKVALVVNVASHWGFTKQYAGLRTLFEDKKGQGFVVLGFPCNQFGKQEPGTDAEILEFVTSKYDVTFPMFSKIDVNGEDAAELYQFLIGEGGSPIQWNFEKFLVDGNGNVVRRYEPKITPEQVAVDVAELLTA